MPGSRGWPPAPAPPISAGEIQVKPTIGARARVLVRQDGWGHDVIPPPQQAGGAGDHGRLGGLPGPQAGHWGCAGEGRRSGEDVPHTGAGAGRQAAHAPGTAQGAQGPGPQAG